jgi:hypothetical protein
LGREDWRAGSQSGEIQREIDTVGPDYEKNNIGGPDNGDLEVRQSDVERRNIGADEVERGHHMTISHFFSSLTFFASWEGERGRDCCGH